MCGIAALFRPFCGSDELWKKILLDLNRRGPDSLQTISVHIDSSTSIDVAAGVLHIQGDAMLVQPFEDNCGNVLLWNGEVFGGIEDLLEDGVSDTVAVSLLFQNTLSAFNLNSSLTDVVSAITQSACKINGPFAFIYYHRNSGAIVYGRDPFGRRSLLALCPVNTQNKEFVQHVLLCSAYGGSGGDATEISLSEDMEWQELSIAGLYGQRLRDNVGNVDSCLVPWPTTRLRLGRSAVSGAVGADVAYATEVASRVHQESVLEDGCDTSQSPCVAEQFLSVLHQALTRRISRVHSLELPPQSLSPVTALGANTPHSPQQEVSSKTHELAPPSACAPTCTIGVLFSGGIDSVLLAALLHISLPATMEKDAIDLINVTFEGDDGQGKAMGKEGPSPDRLAAVAALGELQMLFPSRLWRLVHVDVSPTERLEHEPRIMHLIQPQNTHMDLNIGTAFWFASRGSGYVRPYSFKEVSDSYQVEENGRPLLRSGGEGARRGDGRKMVQDGVGGVQRTGKRRTRKIDKEAYLDQGVDISTVEGGVNKCNEVPLSTHFTRDVDVDVDEKPIDSCPCSRDTCKRIAKPDCPYRLCKMCCDRRYRSSVLIVDPANSIRSDMTNIPELLVGSADGREGGDIQSECPVHKQLKKKGNSETLVTGAVEDAKDSLSADIAQSTHSDQDKDNDIENRQPYTSSCKVLLVGIGADEQLAGYARHRSVFLRGGEAALLQEIQMDTARIWQRNLGRDDRCVCDHGREAWFPFLDELVVDFINNTPLRLICNLSLPMGEGDKKVLRDAAKAIGLQRTSSLVKRAIQFGTRVAKHTNVKYHGSNRKGKGTTALDS